MEGLSDVPIVRNREGAAAEGIARPGEELEGIAGAPQSGCVRAGRLQQKAQVVQIRAVLQADIVQAHGYILYGALELRKTGAQSQQRGIGCPARCRC